MTRLTLDRVRQLAATGIRKARPVTRTVEKVAGLAVQIRGAVTPLTVVGLASTALNALEDFVTPPPSTACDTFIYPVSTATLIAALQADGWVIADTNEVKHWPPAFTNELAARLRLRGLEGSRIDDLRERVGRAVRSREFLGEPRSRSVAPAPTPTTRPR